MFLEIEKIKQASAYLAEKIPNLYTTKFLKLFYYFDFISVLERGTPVSNDTYYHLPYGPIPSFIKDQLYLLKEDRENINSLIMNSDQGEDKTTFQSVLLDVVEMKSDNGKCVITKKDAYEGTLNYLSDYEHDLLDDLIKEFKETATKDIVLKTHNEVPYEQTPESNVIDYKLAFHLDITKILPERDYHFDIELSQAEFFNCR